MAPISFMSTLSVTHIGTATALLTLDSTIHVLTDPFFSPPTSTFPVSATEVLKNPEPPALSLSSLPPIAAVLLSHEDHPDNLDPLGRQLLDGRRVLTTIDGANKLAPRPGVKGLQPWETTTVTLEGKEFSVTATPCEHLPGGECIGFILSSSTFGTTDDKPNVIYFSGDTVYIPALASTIRERYHVVVALLNLGAATFDLPGHGEMMITMDGKQAARLVKEIGAEVVVPMHFESWAHFTQGKSELERVFEEEGVHERVRWLVPGQERKLI
ncbi:putative Zn-dependent hydrolases of the beta-lactamase protein [Lophiostoma macrostomum CBS 122681]|uniref:Putative Zn-dependent hydrolases of the beta-lactamase protein n=1 Tax=Lophiostoma macrostomum CBS 122681 TaxID=1314788 RepID=A0A6A6TFP9_9PLEO|nr:putative Zn-dependent hydrolases of the beta-lactamase protein [Lophiostoma macrostomum CBS 122681]